MKHNIVYSFLVILLIGSIAASTFLVHKQRAQASSGIITGYAWADMPNNDDEVMHPTNPHAGRGAGWISMNCQNDSSCSSHNYGVSEDSSGLLSGYAWSSNIGWISFNGSDLGGCPSGSCQASVDQASGNVTGWARALGIAAESSSEGWIHLSGTAQDKSSYGVSVDLGSCSWSGDAWGGDDIGWIKFSGGDYGVHGCANTVTTPSASISASPNPVSKGDTTTVSWNTSNVKSCSVTGGSINDTRLNGSDPDSPSNTTTYTLNCTGLDDSSVVRSVTVNVNSGKGAGPKAAPPTINYFTHNAVCRLSWSVTGYTSCTITSNGTTVLTFTPSDPTTFNPGSPDVQTTYSLSCVNDDSDAVVAQTTCNPFSEVEK